MPEPSVAADLLNEYIKQDAPQREAVVARYMSRISVVSGLLALALIPLIGAHLGAILGASLLGLATYYFVLGRIIAQGSFHPVISWVNVALEVSAPAVIFVVDATERGPEYALTAPPLVIWGTLIALSGLRSNRWLSLGAGALASLEYGLLYVLVALPRLEPEALLTLRPPLIATRIVLLFASSVFTALFVELLNRRAAEALAAVRARDVFGKYVLHERLGAGGMAEVFRATYNPEGGFQKVVALKRVLPQFAEDQRFLSMFRAEAALCSQFSHPNIVQVFDFGRFGDSYFLAMEFLDGPPLSRILRAHQGMGLPVGAVIHLAKSLCEALTYLHERRHPNGFLLDLVHRDLNPPNILLTRLGDVKLSDFGIARSAYQLQLTDAGTLKGKAGYLAPEQIEGTEFDARVDLFALGVTLWECLTGEQLFAAQTFTTVARDTLYKPVPLVRSLRNDVPEAFATFVHRLLERDPANRMPSARVALKQLRLIDAPTGAKELADAVDLTLRSNVATPVSNAAAERRAPGLHEAVTQPSAR